MGLGRSHHRRRDLVRAGVDRVSAMSNRKYPCVSSYFTRVAKGGDSCQKCGKPIPAGEQMVVAEVQTSWFRGDDEYEYFHARCDPRPPKPVVIHNPPDPARRTCPKCGKMFPVRRDMIQHLKAKHPKGQEAQTS